MDLVIHQITVENNKYIYPAIKFRLHVKNTTSNKVYFSGFYGEITAGSRIVEQIPQQNFQKELGPNRAFNELDVFFLCPQYKIHEIEKLRNNKDLSISISLRFQLYNKDSEHGNTIKDIYEGYAGITHKISMLDWTSLLAELGYGQTRILQLPNPEILKNKPLEKGINLSEEALELLLTGQHEEAFNKCRLALDEIYPLFNRGSGPTPIKLDTKFETLIDKGSSPTPGSPHPNKSVYVDNLRKQIREFSHLSHHGSYKITPEDAELIVYLTIDLINYLSKQFGISEGKWPIP